MANNGGTTETHAVSVIGAPAAGVSVAELSKPRPDTPQTSRLLGTVAGAFYGAAVAFSPFSLRVLCAALPGWVAVDMGVASPEDSFDVEWRGARFRRQSPPEPAR